MKFKEGDIVKVKRISHGDISESEDDEINSKNFKDLLGAVTCETYLNKSRNLETIVGFTEDIDYYGGSFVTPDDTFYFWDGQIVKASKREEFLFLMYGSEVLKKLSTKKGNK